jgi:hypothetical protein
VLNGRPARPVPSVGRYGSFPFAIAGREPELRDFLPRSSYMMNPSFHEMSDRGEAAGRRRLMMQPSLFGVLFLAAALMLIVFAWSPIFDMIASTGNATVSQQKVAYTSLPGN